MYQTGISLSSCHQGSSKKMKNVALKPVGTNWDVGDLPLFTRVSQIIVVNVQTGRLMLETSFSG